MEMSGLNKIRSLVRESAVRFTMHARAEMDADNVVTSSLMRAISSDSSEVVEDYPEDRRGHSCLILVWENEASPIHVCCAVHDETVVIITVYRPRLEVWEDDWRTRK